MSMMSPVSSAVGMNSSGATRPKPGRSHRISASNPRISARVGRDDGLVEEAQLVARDRLAERGFEGDLGRDPLLHRFVEQFVAASTVFLGSVHGDVGVRQDHVRGHGAIGG